MTQYPNQRVQTVEQGMLDLALHQAVLAVRIDATEAGTLYPGSAVVIKDVAGKVITVTEADDDDDSIFGYVVYNQKDSGYVAGDMCEIAYAGSIMHMTAGAAIAKGAKVESDVSALKVITQSSNPVIGIALDKAAADGDLVRVLIVTPGATNAGSFTTIAASGAVTLGSTLSVAGDITPAANVLESYVAYSAGAGALPITKDVIFLTTGGAEALTLADGVIGQRLKIIMVSDGGAGTLTPANFGNGTTITFDDDGDSVELIFDGTNWWTVGTPTATVA